MRINIILGILLLFNFTACTQVTASSDSDNANEKLPAVLGYPIVSTAQDQCYNNNSAITALQSTENFYGQDAQYISNDPSYTNNGDGTVTDMVTGLMWQQGLLDSKYNYVESSAYADTCTLAGYTNWRLPTIKELYSLILFSGVTGMDEASSVPYLDTNYFEFRFGTEFGERFIDSQYATSTLYTSTTMGGNETMFGVNFVDGRIKGYPTNKDFEIKLVRGRDDYGINDFSANPDGTVTDNATGLMWDASGSSFGMNWEEALAYVQTKNSENYLGYNDWRLPDVKELQSIVDYSRSPDLTGAAAIDEVFGIPTITNEAKIIDFPWYWTSTTHVDGPTPNKAAYVCFGRALGYWQGQWQDVHGAGAQRSDNKAGDPNNYPNGHGSQGDAVRILNYVRLVIG